jgi:hypothetical protein
MKSFKEFVKRKDPVVYNEFVGTLWNMGKGAVSGAYNFVRKEFDTASLQGKIKKVTTDGMKMLDKAYKPLLEKMGEIQSLIDTVSTNVKNTQDTMIANIQNLQTNTGANVLNPTDTDEIKAVQDDITAQSQQASQEFVKIKDALQGTYRLATENQKEISNLMTAAEKGIQSQRSLGREQGQTYTGTGAYQRNVLGGQTQGFNKRSAADIRNTANPPPPPPPPPPPSSPPGTP